MSISDKISPIINQLNSLNNTLKDNGINSTIDIPEIVSDIVEKEKEYLKLKYDIVTAQHNLSNNIKLLKNKCDLEYQIYSILIEHKNRLLQLKETNQTDLPEITGFLERLFNLEFNKSVFDNTEIKSNNKSAANKTKNTSFKPHPPSQNTKPNPSFKSGPSKPTPPPAPKFSADTLQSQLSAAIAARGRTQ